VIGLGVNVTNALVVSQIVLSIVLPIPMVALLVLSGKRSVMGAFAARPALLAAAACAVVAIVGLNAVLVVGAIQGN
jgi:manganese transport protein